MSDTTFSTKMDSIKIILAVAIQAGLVIWYVAQADANINARLDAARVEFSTDERRIENNEQEIQQLNASENRISDRLARVEEKLSDELETSRRIEIMIQGMVRRGK